VAQRLDIDVQTVRNWEAQRTVPPDRFLPVIYGFSGWRSIAAKDLSNIIKFTRKARGLSRKAAARIAGVDERTLAKVEAGSKVAEHARCKIFHTLGLESTAGCFTDGGDDTG
jgi:DNA-binding transcriptional regulator YiaG